MKKAAYKCTQTHLGACSVHTIYSQLSCWKSLCLFLCVHTISGWHSTCHSHSQSFCWPVTCVLRVSG